MKAGALHQGARTWTVRFPGQLSRPALTASERFESASREALGDAVWAPPTLYKVQGLQLNELITYILTLYDIPYRNTYEMRTAQLFDL